MTVDESQNASIPIRKKLVIVGEGGCGKTMLLSVQSGLPFSENHVPTVFQTFVSTFSVRGKLVDLSLWDTAGQEQYDRLRPLSYMDSNVVIIAFDITFRHDFMNVVDKWKPEIDHFLPGIPKVLVGLKKDLRTSEPQENLDSTRNPGLVVAKAINACKYFECSAKTGEGVSDIFAYCAKVALNPKKAAKNKPCKVV